MPYTQDFEINNLTIKSLSTEDVSPSFAEDSNYWKQAKTGMTFIRVKLEFENNTSKKLKVNLNKFQITDEKDNQYEFAFYYGIGSPKKKILKIKPGKKIKRSLYFEFPLEKKWNELIIEGKKYKLN